MTTATTLAVIFEKSMYALRIAEAIGTATEWIAVILTDESAAEDTGTGAFYHVL